MDISAAQRILNVGPPEDTEEYRSQLKLALRAAQKQHHPDRNPGDPGATTRFQEATTAYEVLLEASECPITDDVGTEEIMGLLELLAVQHEAQQRRIQELNGVVRALLQRIVTLERSTQRLHGHQRELDKAIARVSTRPTRPPVEGIWDPSGDGEEEEGEDLGRFLSGVLGRLGG